MSTAPFKTPAFGYFPRTEFTAEVKRRMMDFSTNIALFAPRRRGKTTWTLLELQPAAAAWGLEFVYINLWANLADPVGVLAQGLEVAAGLRPADPSTGEISAEITASIFTLKARKDYPPVTHEIAGRIADAMAALAAKPRKTLLVIDEFQALTDADKNNVAIAALRTVLESYGDTILALFTGSKRSTLARMFREQTAPLLEQAKLLDMPELERDFVEDRLVRFRDLTGAQLDLKAVMTAFEGLGRSPLLLNEALKEMAVREGLALDDAIIELIEKHGTEDYGVQIAKLPALDKAILARIAKDQKPYADLDRLPRKRDDAPPVSRTLVQAAIKRLEKAQLIEARDGHKTGWAIPDPLLARWISRVAFGRAA